MTHFVLLPGLHGDAHSWDPVLRALPTEWTARALDLPAVEDLDALVDEVAGRVAAGSVVVGHSLGGVVAMHLAARHPTLLAGLVLVTAPMGTEDPESAAARADRAAGLSSAAYEEIALDGMEAVYYGDRGHDPQVRAERLRAAQGYGPERFAAHSVALGTRPDRWNFPAEAPCPVLIVGASDDQVVPTAEQRRWAEANGARALDTGALNTGAANVGAASTVAGSTAPAEDAAEGGGAADGGELAARGTADGGGVMDGGAADGGGAASQVTYVEIPRTGHMVPVEDPDALARAIGQWWDATRS